MGGETSNGLEYMCGFGNHHKSEALPGAVPVGCNTPQVCPYRLYAEQLNGTAFTCPKATNQLVWMYRIRPTVLHQPFVPHQGAHVGFGCKFAEPQTPNQLRWRPLPLPEQGVSRDWVSGLVTVAGAGDPSLKTGLAIHMYSANVSMVDKAFCDADGDLLFVPECGTLHVRTELGCMDIASGEVGVVQRGLRFSVALDGPSRGYVLETYQGHLKVPDLGPIGANGLANVMDFLTPVAAYEDRECDFTIVQKYLGSLWECHQGHSPFDVVGWHGNYAPYKYDLARFCAMNSVTYDHADPSIFTVLTCATLEPGVAVADFVIFPPRWGVANNTFRPPYYHKNTMSEYMGLIRGEYEAKKDGFVPGGGSLHSCMTGHGPDKKTFEMASTAKLEPERISENSLAFMLESTYMMQATEYAMTQLDMDKDYHQCWADLGKHFTPDKK